jgi:hypothetical protein
MKMYLLRKKFKTINQFYSNYIKKQIATGISEFKELVERSSIIVDKSLLIKKFYEDPGETLLMTYPRRWGKSTNLDMIKTFFEIEVDENGNILSKQDRENYKIFFDNKFFQFKISNSEISQNLVNFESKELQGQFPVISIDFKDTKGDNIEKIIKKIRIQLQKTFSEHKYLLNSNKLQNHEKKKIQIYSGSLEYEKLDEVDISHGLFTLSYFLHKHFKRVIILVDEYDAAINNAYINLKMKNLKKLFHFLGVY